MKVYSSFYGTVECKILWDAVLTLFPERSRMDKLDDASRRLLKTILPKSLSRWQWRSFNEHNDLKAKGSIRKRGYIGQICLIRSQIKQEWSLKWEKMYLPDDRNETSSTTTELGQFSIKLDMSIDKFSILCVRFLLLQRELQIPSTKLGESLQWRNSSDASVSLFWIRSLHNAWTYYLVQQLNQQWK